MQSRRPPSRASYFSLTARTVSRCSRSNAATIPPATFLAKSRFAISACLPNPLPFARQRLTENLLTNRTPEAHQWALEKFRTFRSDGQFVPFTRRAKTRLSSRASMAERNGAAPLPIPRPEFSTSTPTTWLGRALSPRTRLRKMQRTARRLSTSANAPCATEKQWQDLPRQSRHCRKSVTACLLPMSPRRSRTAKAACPASPISRAIKCRVCWRT